MNSYWTLHRPFVATTGKAALEEVKYQIPEKPISIRARAIGIPKNKSRNTPTVPIIPVVTGPKIFSSLLYLKSRTDFF
jgi:hypothetical protein